MVQVLVAIQYAGLFVMMFEAFMVFARWTERIHSWLYFSCITILITSAGYLVQMLSTSEEMFMMGWQVGYIGKVWVPLALFMFNACLCKRTIPRKVSIGLSIFHFVSSIVVLTTQYHKLYYPWYEYKTDRVVPYISHGNGIWYYAYTALVIIYSVGALSLLIKTCKREQDSIAKKRLLITGIALVVILICYGLYMTRLLPGYDFTVMGYNISSILMCLAIFKYRLMDTGSLAKDVIVDKLPEGIVVLNQYGVVSYFNETAVRLFPGIGTLPSEAVDRIETAHKAEEHIAVDDQVFTVEKSDLMQSGQKVGTIYALIDSTEHFRYLEEMNKQREIADNANQAKSTFLANMSHEIRTPINAILGMDEMILRESQEKQTIEYAEDIMSAGGTLLSIINDILDFSKIEEGKLEIIPVQYKTAGLIAYLSNMVRERAVKKNLEFVVRADENLPAGLVGDEIRIRQCILNMLTNAIKYTNEGSVVLGVGFEKKDDANIILNVSVRDTGIGMKEEDIEKLFSPFTRLEEKRNRSIEGTGLGMSITRQLLSLMDSSLRVESTYGSGSMFAFSVIQKVEDWTPMGDYSKQFNEAGKGMKEYQELFHAPSARVLVVDDTKVNITVIRSLLKRTKMKVDVAISGFQALKLAEENYYDIMLIDHMMPEMDGIETLKKLKEMHPDAETKYVALTANAISGAREMYLEAGFDDYLSKPVNGKMLEDMLKICLPPEKIEPAD